MDRPSTMSDGTLARLYTLTARLTERIGEGEDVRARLTRAIAASAWPDLRSAARHPPPDDRCRD